MWRFAAPRPLARRRRRRVGSGPTGADPLEASILGRAVRRFRRRLSHKKHSRLFCGSPVQRGLALSMRCATRVAPPQAAGGFSQGRARDPNGAPPRGWGDGEIEWRALAHGGAGDPFSRRRAQARAQTARRIHRRSLAKTPPSSTRSRSACSITIRCARKKAAPKTSHSRFSLRRSSAIARPTRFSTN